MGMSIRSKVINIGNSRGIRIPRALLEQAGLHDEVELTVQDDRLIIQAVSQPREGWAAQFAQMAEQRDDQLLEDFVPTTWDNEEWVW